MTSNHPSKGRQSLPPMSVHSLTTPTSSRHSLGGGGGSMILSSTRVKPTSATSGSAGSGLSTSRSMGNLRGSSEGLLDKDKQKPPKKKNKKGMKGWAWVVEDENGNIIDAPDSEVDAAADADGGPGAGAENPTISRSRDGGEEDEMTAVEDSNIGIRSTSSIHQLINQDEANDDKPISRLSNSTIVQNDNDLYASSPMVSRASTATAEIIPSKRTRKSSSPAVALTPKDSVNHDEGE
ncbi:hypothetical protein I204_00571 [Kwoniella mangroviensis CBS 8886]|uniref:uncharacterized protein n=1 Tax=Kwoniella mangroviensis CBS 8507 TaxID=1296122 RepID=UPI00080D210C|nr:uncharacterized protein I203_07181 [Kwoniella mangroviensis CBS 8507]OCF63860.1 hypothetical protein I203_07181 [Kwoniella mangroviensis CBS 8507]OCF78629.1 hypothetical protein I204_00571 [Kwoniella mangroviensis CBS 8886]